jgi:hypothetical protein
MRPLSRNPAAKVQRTPVKPLCDVAKRMRHVRRNADLGRHVDLVLLSECLGIRFAISVKELLLAFLLRELLRIEYLDPMSD